MATSSERVNTSYKARCLITNVRGCSMKTDSSEPEGGNSAGIMAHVGMKVYFQIY
jgi:hypothetical protein